ncbi:MAG: hypothetical protein R2706_06175 [Acidimicrobiales bacterium]
MIPAAKILFLVVRIVSSTMTLAHRPDANAIETELAGIRPTADGNK